MKLSEKIRRDFYTNDTLMMLTKTQQHAQLYKMSADYLSDLIAKVEGLEEERDKYKAEVDHERRYKEEYKEKAVKHDKSLIPEAIKQHLHEPIAEWKEKAKLWDMLEKLPKGSRIDHLDRIHMDHNNYGFGQGNWCIDDNNPTGKSRWRAYGKTLAEALNEYRKSKEDK